MMMKRRNTKVPPWIDDIYIISKRGNIMSKELKFTYHRDYRHGWIAVKRKLLEDLNLIDQISAYSYERGKTVYLEEDSDAEKLLKLLDNSQIKYRIVEGSRNYEVSPIRNYDMFVINKR